MNAEGVAVGSANTVASTIQILSHRNDSDNAILSKKRERIAEIGGKLQSARDKYQQVCIRETQIQKSLYNRKFNVGIGSVKIQALHQSCEKLQLDIEKATEKTQEAKLELSRYSDANLEMSVEFAKHWSLTQAGKQFRKEQEVTVLRDVTEAKFQLELELMEFLEKEKIYEDALRQKTEYECQVEKERESVSQKEQELIPVIHSTKRNVEELMKEQKDCSNKFLLEKERLEKRIKNARSSIDRIKSRCSSKNVFNQPQNLSLKTNSVVGFVANFNNSSTPCLLFGNSNLESVVYNAVQAPPEKYRCLELESARTDSGRNGTTGTAESSMIVVPDRSQSRTKFSFKKKPSSSASTLQYGEHYKDINMQ